MWRQNLGGRCSGVRCAHRSALLYKMLAGGEGGVGNKRNTEPNTKQPWLNVPNWGIIETPPSVAKIQKEKCIKKLKLPVFWATWPGVWKWPSWGPDGQHWWRFLGCNNAHGCTRSQSWHHSLDMALSSPPEGTCYPRVPWKSEGSPAGKSRGNVWQRRACSPKCRQKDFQAHSFLWKTSCSVKQGQGPSSRLPEHMIHTPPSLASSLDGHVSMQGGT